MHKEGKEPGQQTKIDQRGVPYHVASCSTLKPGKEGEQGRFQSDHFCLPKRLLCAMSPAFLGIAEQPPADGKQ